MSGDGFGGAAEIGRDFRRQTRIDRIALVGQFVRNADQGAEHERRARAERKQNPSHDSPESPHHRPHRAASVGHHNPNTRPRFPRPQNLVKL